MCLYSLEILCPFYVEKRCPLHTGIEFCTKKQKQKNSLQAPTLPASRRPSSRVCTLSSTMLPRVLRPRYHAARAILSGARLPAAISLACRLDAARHAGGRARTRRPARRVPSEKPAPASSYGELGGRGRGGGVARGGACGRRASSSHRRSTPTRHMSKLLLSANRDTLPYSLGRPRALPPVLPPIGAGQRAQPPPRHHGIWVALGRWQQWQRRCQWQQSNDGASQSRRRWGGPGSFHCLLMHTVPYLLVSHHSNWT